MPRFAIFFVILFIVVLLCMNMSQLPKPATRLFIKLGIAGTLALVLTIGIINLARIF